MSIGRLGAVIRLLWIFLWGTLKDKCYANHPETIDALKHEIEIAIHAIGAQTIEYVLRNWVDRIGYWLAVEVI